VWKRGRPSIFQPRPSLRPKSENGCASDERRNRATEAPQPDIDPIEQLTVLGSRKITSLKLSLRVAGSRKQRDRERKREADRERRARILGNHFGVMDRGSIRQMQRKAFEDKRKARVDPNRWITREDDAMLGAFWSWLKDPANRDVIAWIGGGLVVVVGGVWAVVKYFAMTGGDGRAAPRVRADRGGVAAGGSISNSQINTNSEKENVNKGRKTKT
jgi:hypothetical protein